MLVRASTRSEAPYKSRELGVRVTNRLNIRGKSKLTSLQGPELSSVLMTVAKTKTVCHTPWPDGHSEKKSPPQLIVAQTQPPRPRVVETARSAPPRPTTLVWEDRAYGAPAKTTATRGMLSRGSSSLGVSRRDRAPPRGQPA
jgi:hypothetical protein